MSVIIIYGSYYDVADNNQIVNVGVNNRTGKCKETSKPRNHLSIGFHFERFFS